MMGRLTDELDLGEKQKEKIQELREAAREQLEGAESPEKRREVMQQLQQDIRALLTKDQLAELEKLKEARAGRRGRGPGRTMRRGPGARFGMLRRRGGRALDLTDEQREKMARLRKGLREKLRDAETPEQRREILKNLRGEIQGVLTPEQRKKIEAFRQKHGLGLSEAQREKIHSILAEARKNIRQILTDEQRQKRGDFRRRRGRFGRGMHPGRGPRRGKGFEGDEE
ncbi:MAG: hypothetical protein R6V58_03625 [Planctomycetota bacterium]